MLANRILSEPHVPLLDVAPGCPRFLALITDKALSKNPRLRHESAHELSQVLSEAMHAFAYHNGPSQPLDVLAARMFPDGRCHLPSGLSVRAAKGSAPDLGRLKKTAPLDAHPGRAQPMALPYLPTAHIPRWVIESASRNDVKPAREPPRGSDVFVKRAALAETERDLRLPAAVRAQDESSSDDDDRMATLPPAPAPRR